MVGIFFDPVTELYIKRKAACRAAFLLFNEVRYISFPLTD
jgi:hypothetical protein